MTLRYSKNTINTGKYWIEQEHNDDLIERKQNGVSIVLLKPVFQFQIRPDPKLFFLKDLGSRILLFFSHKTVKSLLKMNLKGSKFIIITRMHKRLEKS